MSDEGASDIFTSEYLESKIPGLEVGSVLGIGGMGAVYKSRQKSLDREAALKILSAEWQGNEGIREMFQREARAMAKLSHPNLVGVYDFGFLGDGGAAYLLMEYVHGEELHRIAQRGKIDPKKVAAILVQVASGLGYAHSQGVVHLDIKPSNVMITTKGVAKVLDFGLANIANEAGQASGSTPNFGTPDYAGPEMFGDQPSPDHRSDVYAMGAMLYELLTGDPPRGEYQRASKLSGCDRAYDDIVNKCLKHSPEDRFQSMAELSRELAVVASGKKKSKPGLVSGAIQKPSRSPVTPAKPGSSADKATKASAAAVKAAYLAQQQREQKIATMKMMVGLLAILGLVAFAFKVYSDKKANQNPDPQPGIVTPAPAPAPGPAPSPSPGPEPSPEPGPEPAPRPPRPSRLASTLPDAILSELPHQAERGLLLANSTVHRLEIPGEDDVLGPEGGDHSISANEDPWSLRLALTSPRQGELKEGKSVGIFELGSGDHGVGLYFLNHGGQLETVFAGMAPEDRSFVINSDIEPGSTLLIDVAHTPAGTGSTQTFSLSINGAAPETVTFESPTEWIGMAGLRNGVGRRFPTSDDGPSGAGFLLDPPYEFEDYDKPTGYFREVMWSLYATDKTLVSSAPPSPSLSLTVPVSSTRAGPAPGPMPAPAPAPSPEPEPEPEPAVDPATLVTDAQWDNLPRDASKGVLVANSTTNGTTLPTNMGAAFGDGRHINPNNDAWRIDFAFTAPDRDELGRNATRALMDMGDGRRGIGVFLINRPAGPEIIICGSIDTAQGKGNFYQSRAVPPGKPVLVSIHHVPFSGEEGDGPGSISMKVNDAPEQSAPYQHPGGWVGSVVANGFGTGIPKVPAQIGGYAPIFAPPISASRVDLDAFAGDIPWALYAEPKS